MDAFGHASVRHPDRPDRFLLACSRPPEQVRPDDILVFGEDSEPVEPCTEPLYSERFIHGEIYRLRPDVQAICHHHAPAVMPFCVSGVPLVPVTQHGATMGATIPFWDSRDDFGDTNLLVTTAAQAASLARALGPHSMVLMRRHGATSIGRDIEDMVFRAVSACRNAQIQSAAMAMGAVDALTPGEVDLAARVPPSAVARAWRCWVDRLAAA
ncbi:hypothetical protein CH341_10620 [Rhodoplanes roseus]|uniref:Class II aldolase/adducin N-terminal domain-containing protein n=3 Tax=Rhodoplanes TaxID=29407 RepID=A0A327L1N7_9BRAD|nr:hypothetical protein CH341_10620 [Rhodoplanes roseus]